ncbi:DASS family sodium-coupled anion symporter [Roseomonas stagni]|uniref:DASS family sodium-coupled anion symporter n=1 Tax=Falsiroseomonas algicola TaxID=2716930 RepID=A0A6M1LIH5_9PROT|nr:DASS family sodium-coupled anion symporter [Falsiroseomonas algicola]NGM20103.1 DASS family sodium-coupled anion symporter [Falsiroseomonas algicola]
MSQPQAAASALPSGAPGAAVAPTRARTVGLILGPILFAVMLALPPPAGLEPVGWRVAAVAVLMATWWMTEAVPIPVTGLLPLVLFPALGIASGSAASAPYADPLIFLFLGGFLIALGLERWNLHRRIALRVVAAVGTRPAALVGGFMLATAFLSMWVSNTATAVMMLPIGLSVIGLLSRDGEDAGGFGTALLLGIAYSASIGGLATLIGTPPNALLAAFVARSYGIEIGFAQWMAIGLPITVALLLLAWLILTRLAFRLPTAAVTGSAALIRDELGKLGRLSGPEIRVGLVFLAAAFLWVSRPALSGVLPAGVNDTVIAIAAGVALFIIPAGGANPPGTALLDWSAAKRLPWGVLLLFGGGLALASAIGSSGLAAWIGAAFAGLDTWPVILVVVLVTAAIVFLTELTSNTATAAAFLPLMASVAPALGADPFLLTIPVALAASCAFMLPVATPPNAIVFGSGHLTVAQMARAGFLLNLAGIVAIVGLTWLFVGPVFAVPEGAGPVN